LFKTEKALSYIPTEHTHTHTHNLTFYTYMDATSQPKNIKLKTGSLIKTYTKET